MTSRINTQTYSEKKKLMMRTPLRWFVLLAFVVLTLLIINAVVIAPEKQKRLQRQVNFNHLQALLNMPKTQTKQADKTEIPALLNELKLTSYSNHNGIQQYEINGSFFDLYRWLQQLQDSQWYPQQADWQWQGESVELGITLVTGAHKASNIPGAEVSPFPKPQERAPELLPETLVSCLEFWPENLKLAATIGSRLVLDNGSRQWQYQQGDMHSSSGLVFSNVNNGEVVLSFALTNSKIKLVEGSEASLQNIANECVPGVIRVNETDTQQPRWLP